MFSKYLLLPPTIRIEINQFGIRLCGTTRNREAVEFPVQRLKAPLSSALLPGFPFSK